MDGLPLYLEDAFPNPPLTHIKYMTFMRPHPEIFFEEEETHNKEYPIRQQRNDFNTSSVNAMIIVWKHREALGLVVDTTESLRPAEKAFIDTTKRNLGFFQIEDQIAKRYFYNVLVPTNSQQLQHRDYSFQDLRRHEDLQNLVANNEEFNLVSTDVARIEDGEVTIVEERMGRCGLPDYGGLVDLSDGLSDSFQVDPNGRKYMLASQPKVMEVVELGGVLISI